MVATLKNEQRARVFRNGRSRAVRLPREFDFEGDEVIIRREADGVLSIVPDKTTMTPAELAAWLRAQPLPDSECPWIEDFPPLPFALDRP